MIYRLGRALQFLALVDCGYALMLGISNPAAYGTQLLILASAVVLFGAGRLLQQWGAPSSGGGSGGR